MTDPKLAEDARRAVRSVVENVGEAGGRFGKDRPHHDSIAYGSGRELRTQLAMAELDGGLVASELEEPRALLERELGLLWSTCRVGRTDLSGADMIKSFRIAV